MSDNPYAPSAVDDVAEAPASHGWEMVEGRLIVEKEATLPMIDPFTGASEDRMVLFRLAVRRRYLWPRHLFLGGLCLSLASAWMAVGEAIAPLFEAMMAVGLLASVLIPVLSRPAWILVFMTRRTVRREELLKWGALVGIVLVLGLVVVVPNIPGISVGVVNALTVLFVVILVVAVGSRWLQRRLVYRRYVGERFEIRGLHPKALEAMMRIQNRS